MMQKRLWGGLMAGAALLGGCVGTQAAAAKEVSATVLPGGVADASGKTGYFGAERGGMDAVDLATGRTLWHADGAQTPLLVAGNRVYAWETDSPANSLQITWSDVTRGGRFLEKQITFPAWVSTRGDSFQGTFQAQARVAGETLMFQWWASKRLVFGNPPAQGVPPPVRASGLARVNLKTGRVAQQNDATPLAPPPPPSRGPVTLGGRTFTLVELPAGGLAPHPRRLECRDAVGGRLLWTHALAPRPEDKSRLVM